MKIKKKAVIMFSGGLDSTVALCWALNKGYECFAITISYGQKHVREKKSAQIIAKLLGIKLFDLKLDLPWLESSSLVDKNKKIPNFKLSEINDKKIPSTYVPGRNLMFTSIGVSLADSIGAEAVVLGPNVLDYSGYPDCRPVFYNALEKAVNLGTEMGSAGKKIKLLMPLIKLSKADIVKLAVKLKAPLQHTWSCYAGLKEPCGVCDSCKLRAKGFAEAGVKDLALKFK
ncbi:MAG: 7-cyano-7-deazaguanine synthase QueC [Elusimicrobiota bacterium]|nr:7-cyano-7-deazaguanine synthase QueC [Elusimicrobiota bacterium]